MRRLTPLLTRQRRPCLAEFYVRRIRDGRDLYGFMVGRRPGAAPARPHWWARWFG